MSTKLIDRVAVEIAMAFPTLAADLRIQSAFPIDGTSKNCITSNCGYVSYSEEYDSKTLSNDEFIQFKETFLAATISTRCQHFLRSVGKRHINIFNETVVDTPLLFKVYDLLTFVILKRLASIPTSGMMNLKPYTFSQAQINVLDKFKDTFTNGYVKGADDLFLFAAQFIRTLNGEEQKVISIPLLDRYPATQHLFTFDEAIKGNAEYEDDEGYSTTETRSRRAIGGRGGILQSNSIFDTVNFLMHINELGYDSFFSSFMLATQFTISKVHTDLNAIIQATFAGAFKNDYGYSRPNMRYITSGLIMPAMINNTANIVFAFDHSGSVKDAESNEQFGAIDNVLSNQPAYNATVYAFSTLILAKQEFNSPSTLLENMVDIASQLSAKGGTTFQCVIEEVSQDTQKLATINAITIISADGAGGELTLSGEFINTFKGKLILMFGDCGGSRLNAIDIVANVKAQGFDNIEAVFYTVV